MMDLCNINRIENQSLIDSTDNIFIKHIIDVSSKYTGTRIDVGIDRNKRADRLVFFIDLSDYVKKDLDFHNLFIIHELSIKYLIKKQNFMIIVLALSEAIQSFRKWNIKNNSISLARIPERFKDTIFQKSTRKVRKIFKGGVM